MGSGQVQPAQRLGRYELLARLASGGMGEIFLARMEGAAGFEKLVVVKRILPHLADDVRFRQMLIAEARIASKLSHANICQVYELGETDGQLYIVMEYLEGVTLLPVLRQASRDQTPLEFGFVGAVVQQGADALHYAHEMHDRDGSSLGIVHRDVTPSNVFLTDAGVVKILDFGIAKAKGASSAHTQTGAVKGKYAYMAPEQLRGATEIDRRVDVFALGIALFEMIALRRLFQRKTDYLTFRAVMEQPIPDLRHYRPDAPEPLCAVVARALDRDPTKRFDSARQLSAAMLDALAASGMRPWSQGELGDYVRDHFRSDLGKRSSQVAGAIQRTQPGSTRVTMPILANPEAPDEPADEDDTEFPPVETAIDTAPPGGMLLPTPVRGVLAVPSAQQDFGGHTPQPFGVESTSSGAALQPLGTVVPRAPAPARSLLWPMVALGAVAIAGGALVLVWLSTQKPPTPTSVVITTDHDGKVGSAEVGSAAAAEGSPAGSGSGSGSAAAITPPVHPTNPPPSHPRQSPYDRAIAGLKPAIDSCVKRNADVTTPTSASLHIDATGKPTQVTLQPAAANQTALGACLRTALQSARFPSTPTDTDLTFPFRVKAG